MFDDLWRRVTELKCEAECFAVDVSMTLYRRWTLSHQHQEVSCLKERILQTEGTQLQRAAMHMHKASDLLMKALPFLGRLLKLQGTHGRKWM